VIEPVDAGQLTAEGQGDGDDDDDFGIVDNNFEPGLPGMGSMFAADDLPKETGSDEETGDGEDVEEEIIQPETAQTLGGEQEQDTDREVEEEVITPKKVQLLGSSEKSDGDANQNGRNELGDNEDVTEEPEFHPKDVRLNKKPLVLPGGHTLKNNGHSAALILNGDNYIHGGQLGNGDRYKIHHLHFHWGSSDDVGSEHSIDGQSIH